jgi:hypothetical protein
MKKPQYTLLTITLSTASLISAVSQDLGNGFFDHGVTAPVSNHRGTVATIDGNGRNVVLVWLFDHRGGYGLEMIDAETGKSEHFPMPFPPGDAVYSSILSSKNKFYTLFKSNFVEFDPVRRAFTYNKESMPQMAMSMTEDDQGIIWAVTYPNSGMVSFNPVTREFRDYGYLYKQNWRQYPRSLVKDDAGWLYFGIGNTASQIIAFNPVSGEVKPMLNESERKRGSAYVYRNRNGKVYGQPLQNSKEKNWYEFYKGKGHKIGKHNPVHSKPIITGSQSLFHGDFPDGKRIKDLDLLKRILIIEDPKNHSEKEVRFDYASEGAWVMGIAASPDGTIAGGTTFPMRFINYNPKTGKIVHLEALGQYDAMEKQGDRFYFAVYPQGALLEWNPSRPWVNTKEGANTNPLYLAGANPVIHRPHEILACPDGKTIIMSGTPEYGYTGGGLLFWDREKKTKTVLQDSAVILDQSTMSMVALPGGKFLGGTTTSPGTGGEKKAKEALLYIMDLDTKKLEWQKVLIPGVQSYSDMCLGPDGLVYGMTDRNNLFVFNPANQLLVHQEEVASRFGMGTAKESPRIFVSGPKGEIYLLLRNGIVRIEPGSFKLYMIAESPVPIETGGDYFDGRIYFVSGSHLCSYKF